MRGKTEGKQIMAKMTEELKQKMKEGREKKLAEKKLLKEKQFLRSLRGEAQAKRAKLQK